MFPGSAATKVFFHCLGDDADDDDDEEEEEEQEQDGW